MPTDACQFYYGARIAKTMLRPKPDDCRVLFVQVGTMSADSAAAWVLRVARRS